MRPVRLDIDGFASFREPTHVDFTDVDYFALVGPTGSGKSTIIDAITFALYGTAHRWERANGIAYALAPTSNRCTVSLIFDVGGHRYQAVREVRRVGAQIQQKNARLERLSDPTACPAPGEETASEVLASEVRDMTPAVAELLGLDFDDFCQCVVLPQGEFARFLKAKSSDRQDILLKLLGAGHYDEIAKRAARRAADAQKEADVYAEQLGTLSHASAEALTASQVEAARLEDVATKISDQVGITLAAREQQRLHQDTIAAGHRAVAALSSITAPQGLAQRHEKLVAARLTAAVTAEASTAAAATLNAAIDAATSGPQRATIEGLARLYADAHNVDSLLTAAHKSSETSTTAAAQAQQDATAAGEALTTARTAAAQATTIATTTKTALDSLDLMASRLRAVRAPADLDEIAGTAERLAAALATATAHATQARSTLDRLEAGTANLPDPRRLRSLTEQAQALQRSVEECHRLEADLERARTHAAEARAELTTAETQRTAAQHTLDEARAADGALTLRVSLEVGHECPVCTQTVSTLPASESGPDLAEAQDRLTEAARALVGAQQANESSQEQLAAQRARVEHAVAHVGRTAAGVAHETAQAATRVDVGIGAWGAEGWSPGVDAVADQLPHLLTCLDQTTTASELLLTEREAARTALIHAESAVTTLRTEREAATSRLDEVRSGLIRAHAGVADYDAPPVETDSLHAAAAGWRALSAWAGEQLAEVDQVLAPTARTAYEQAVASRDACEQTLATAEATAAQLTATARDAASDASAAQTRHTGLLARRDELAVQLDQAPERADLTGLLAQAHRLEEDRGAASAAVAQARTQTAAADEALRAASAAVAADRDALGAARDQAGPWSPPTFDAGRLEDDLSGCWTELLSWSAARSDQASDELTRAETAATETQTLAAAHLATLLDTLGEHDLDITNVAEDPRSAERVVAVAHSEARARVQTLTEARERAGALAEKESKARETATVAGELRSLLRADKFGNWLATAALDTLVVGASDSLMQLSDGQFTLTHIKGDFHVIDHFDADSERSVKTLSGGETFQASLALALSLSEQLATLAAGGNAKLDSIFLDEGFGTLDPESLETVAATLETLAQGERMVGVVTHVAALAERTPTRFTVHHDGRTSSVERETT